MFDLFGLSDFGTSNLPSLLRRTMVTALVLGVVAVGVAIALNQGFAALGISVGLVAGWANHRVLDRSVARVRTTGEPASDKTARRAIGSRTLARLGAVTAVAVVLLVFEPPMGLGVVIGLVVFQLSFVANAARAILTHGG